MLVQSGGFSAQDTVRGTFALSSIIGYRNGTILATLCPPMSLIVPAQSDLRFRRCTSKKFKMGAMAAILDVRMHGF